MRRFILKILLLFLVSASLLLGSLFFIPDRVAAASLLGALTDKHRLLERTRVPKIIFVGGSNVSFGLDSRLISAELRMPVINMALHGGLGLKYAIDDCLPHVGKGDLVVLIPEYENYYTGNFYGEIELVSVLFDIDRGGLQHISAQQWRHLLPHLPTYAAKKLRNFIFSPFTGKTDASPVTIYDRRSFNEFGDACLHWAMPNQAYLPGKKATGSEQVDPEVLSYIDHFKRTLAEKSASCILLPPAIDSTSFSNQRGIIEKIAQRLTRQSLSSGISPARYAFPDYLFFNSYYHLNRKGVDLRTKLVLEDIRRVLPLSQK